MVERRYRPGISVVDGKIYVFGGEEGWDRYGPVQVIHLCTFVPSDQVRGCCNHVYLEVSHQICILSNCRFLEVS